MEDNITWR